MPLFFQQQLDADTRLGIWKIGEEAAFFEREVVGQRQVTHPHKALQHLAGRYLLRLLYPDFPLSAIRIADTRKPFLEDERYHFSLSHAGDYAAALVSRTKRVGVDVEEVSAKVERVQHKFITQEEADVLQAGTGGAPREVSHQQLVTLAWSVKEAVFKWYGLGGVDFRAHIELITVASSGPDRFATGVRFKKNEDLYLGLHSIFFEGLCLSYTFT